MYVILLFYYCNYWTILINNFQINKLKKKIIIKKKKKKIKKKKKKKKKKKNELIWNIELIL